MAKLTFRSDACKGCGLCVDACPKHLLKLSEEIINKKGATAYGIGMCLVKITSAILENKNSILPVSSWDTRNNICISTPAIVGKDGVADKIYIPLNEEETIKLSNSVNVIKEAINHVINKNG